MVKVILESASNGVVKIVEDDNYNGAHQLYTESKVYEIGDDEDSTKKTLAFLSELIEDIGIYTGNKGDRNVLTLGLDWGSAYVPTDDEISHRIKTTKKHLDVLKELEKARAQKKMSIE